MSINRSNDIAVSKPEINMDGLLMVARMQRKAVCLRLASGKFGGRVADENCCGYAHAGLWDRLVYLIVGRSFPSVVSNLRCVQSRSLTTINRAVSKPTFRLTRRIEYDSPTA